MTSDNPAGALPSDEELARRAQQGCRASLDQLLRRFQRRVLHFLQQRVGPRDAEDLAQETFLRLRAIAPLPRAMAVYRVAVHDRPSHGHQPPSPSAAGGRRGGPGGGRIVGAGSGHGHHGRGERRPPLGHGGGGPFRRAIHRPLAPLRRGHADARNRLDPRLVPRRGQDHDLSRRKKLLPLLQDPEENREPRPPRTARHEEASAAAAMEAPYVP